MAVEPSTIAILQIRLMLVLGIPRTFKSSLFENLALRYLLLYQNGMQGLELHLRAKLRSPSHGLHLFVTAGRPSSVTLFFLEIQKAP